MLGQGGEPLLVGVVSSGLDLPTDAGDQLVPDAVRAGLLGVRGGDRPDEPGGRLRRGARDGCDPPLLPTTRGCVSHGRSSPCRPAPGLARRLAADSHRNPRPLVPAGCPSTVSHTPAAVVPILPATRVPRRSGYVLDRPCPMAAIRGRRAETPGGPTRDTVHPSRSPRRVPFYARSIVGRAPNRKGIRRAALRHLATRCPGACVARNVPGGRIARRPQPDSPTEFRRIPSSPASLNQTRHSGAARGFARGAKPRAAPWRTATPTCSMPIVSGDVSPAFGPGSARFPIGLLLAHPRQGRSSHGPRRRASPNRRGCATPSARPP